MKRINLISILFLALCLHACISKPHPYTLQAADTLVYSNADSAIALLEQLKDSIASESEATQNYYRLLWIKANDKAYIHHTSDSLIRLVLDYYENKADKKQLPEVYYYAGRVYSDLGDAPQALDYFQKAAERLKGSNNYQLLKVVHSQMGELLLFQGVYEEAMKEFKNAYHYNSNIHNNRGMIINLCNIGTTFTGLGNADSALFYYQRAYEQAEKIGDNSLMDKAQSNLSSLYIQLKQYDLAMDLLRTSNSPKKISRRMGRYFLAAKLYHGMDKLDSATYYYKKLTNYDDIYGQQAAHLGLAEIAQKRGESQEALKHIHQYNECTDSIQKITDSESIRKMQSYYNYQLREKENNRLRLNNARQEQKYLYSLITIVLLTSFSIIYFLCSREKKTQLKVQLDKLEQVKEEQYRKSTVYIQENLQKIKELEDELQISKNDKDYLHQLYVAQKEQILRMNSKIEADQKEQSLAEIAFHQSEIYNKFHDAANGTGTLTSQDWEILRIKVDRCYKDFTARLRALHPISDMEMKISLLLKIGISVTGISLLTGRSKSAIVSARKKLYKKTHGEVEKPEQWDKFILSF